MPTKLPALIAHADWSKNPKKRWIASARLMPDQRYIIDSSQQVLDAGNLLDDLRVGCNPDDCILIGFDFPIGLPWKYAQKAGIDDFLSILPKLGNGKWADFYRVAKTAEQIRLRRPFYPARPGNTRRDHLSHGLGIDFPDLYRICESPREERRAACPLFWTLGGQQVGKAAITGWQEIIAPGLQKFPADQIGIWPFSGNLSELIDNRKVVIAETYPAEAYSHLGIDLSFRNINAHQHNHAPDSATSRKFGKRSQLARTANQALLLDWGRQWGVLLTPGTQFEIQQGFGEDHNGEDRFDAMVGLLGMLNVILGGQPAGDPLSGNPDYDKIRKFEGWILGQYQCIIN